MDYAVEHHAFEDREIIVRWSPVFAPKVYLDGEEIKGRFRSFPLIDGRGNTWYLRLRYLSLDAVPTVHIGDRRIFLARRLYEHELAWVSVAYVLGGLFFQVTVRLGLLGPVLGISGLCIFIYAGTMNALILRSEYPPIVRYGLGALVYLAALALCVAGFCGLLFVAAWQGANSTADNTSF